MKHLFFALLLCSPSPTTPSGLHASYGPQTTTLSWSSKDTGPFLIYAGESPTTLTPYTFSFTPSYTFSALEPGETYYLAVTSWGCGGESPPSEILAVNPPE